MPGVARKGDDVLTGHGCDVTTTILEHSPDVFADGIAVARKGDMLTPHTINSGVLCVPHIAQINAGSGTVFVNGIAIARKTDSADMGNIVGSSSTVFAN